MFPAKFNFVPPQTDRRSSQKAAGTPSSLPRPAPFFTLGGSHFLALGRSPVQGGLHLAPGPSPAPSGRTFLASGPPPALSGRTLLASGPPPAPSGRFFMAHGPPPAPSGRSLLAHGPPPASGGRLLSDHGSSLTHGQPLRVTASPRAPPKVTPFPAQQAWTLVRSPAAHQAIHSPSAPQNESVPAEIIDLGVSVIEFFLYSPVFTPKERLARILAAHRLFDAGLSRNWHPDTSDEFREQFIVSRARMLSPGSLRDAVTAVLALEAFCADAQKPAYPPDPVVLAQFLQSVLRRRRNVPADKGLAARGRLRGLTVAGAHGGAPFPPSILAHSFVVSAANCAASSSSSCDFLVSLALVCLMEDLALADYWDDPKSGRSGSPRPVVSKFVSLMCQSLLIQIHCCSRTSTALRFSPIAYQPADDVLPHDRILLHSTGDKASRSDKMTPATHVCVAQGFTPGMPLWFHDWFVRFEGRGFIIDTVVASPARSLALASAWANVPAGTADVTSYVRQIASLPPISQPIEQSLAVGLSARAFRHVYASLGAALHLSEVSTPPSQFALGNWKQPTGKQPALPMPDRYAGSELALLRGALARLRVSSAVSSWIGDRPWTSCVPLQSGQRPSFSFLASASHGLSASASSVPSPSSSPSPASSSASSPSTTSSRRSSRVSKPSTRLRTLEPERATAPDNAPLNDAARSAKKRPRS